MAKKYADLWKEASNLKEEGKNVANFKGNVAKLPYTLKDEFRKRQDPKLDEAINKAQSNTFGAAIKGLNMYQDISNPFARRDLAEQYQGGVEQGWKNLVDERTRRKGVYADYINKWTGLYGAEAAKRQNIFENEVSSWNREKTLADTDENNRRWNIENARAEKTSSKKNDEDDFWSYAQNELNSSVGSDGKYDPNVYNRVREEALSSANINKKQFDAEMSSGINERDYGTTGIETKERDYVNENKQAKAKNVQDIMNKAKSSEKEADYGDLYWKGTKIYRKVNWGTDDIVYDPDNQ